MFNVEKAILEWRNRMAAGGFTNDEILNELEGHIRDEVEQHQQAGLGAKEAFEEALESIGQVHALKDEFAKLRQPTWGFLARLKSILMRPAGVSAPSLADFASSARETLELASQEAPLLNHDFIGTEHVLLGLLKPQNGAVTNLLGRLGLTADLVRSEIQKLIGPGLPMPGTAATIPYTPRALKALNLAGCEAKALHQKEILPEHIFLGLIKEGHGVAALVLKNLGMDIKKTREGIIKEMDQRESDG